MDLAWNPAQRAKKSDSVPPAFKRLDHLDAVERGGQHLALLLLEAAAGVRATPRADAQGDQVEQRDGNADDRQQDVVLDHDERVERDHRDVDEVRRDPRRQQLRDSFVELRPRCDVGGIAQVEEGDGQVQHVPDEAPGRAQLQLLAEPEQDVLLQPVEYEQEQQRQPHRSDEWWEPALQAADKDVVDEDAAVRRDQQTGDDQRHPRENSIDERGV